MSSVTAAASAFLGMVCTKPQQPPSLTRRCVVPKATVGSTERQRVKVDDASNGRRHVLVLPVAVATACWTAGKVALAGDDEPKRGTPEAKKKYAPICVTMPTARICHN